HNPLHVLMPRLVDLAGASLAQPFQNDVRPQHQLGAAAAKELIELVRGQPAVPQELTGQGARITELALQSSGFFQLLCGQQLMAAQGLDQCCSAGNAHLSNPNRASAVEASRLHYGLPGPATRRM